MFSGVVLISHHFTRLCACLLLLLLIGDGPHRSRYRARWSPTEDRSGDEPNCEADGCRVAIWSGTHWGGGCWCGSMIKKNVRALACTFFRASKGKRLLDSSYFYYLLKLCIVVISCYSLFLKINSHGLCSYCTSTWNACRFRVAPRARGSCRCALVWGIAWSLHYFAPHLTNCFIQILQSAPSSPQNGICGVPAICCLCRLGIIQNYA